MNKINTKYPKQLTIYSKKPHTLSTKTSYKLYPRVNITIRGIMYVLESDII